MRYRRTVKIIIDIARYRAVYLVYRPYHLEFWFVSIPFQRKIHSAKTIIPFFTHNGSSSGASSISTVAKLCSDSTVLIDDYFTYSGNNVDKAESDVDEWLSELGYKN